MIHLSFITISVSKGQLKMGMQKRSEVGLCNLSLKPLKMLNLSFLPTVVAYRRKLQKEKHYCPSTYDCNHEMGSPHLDSFA